jgi:hypothetical protein
MDTILGKLLWAALMYAVSRCLAWIFGATFTKGKEAAFLVVVPATVFVLLAAINSSLTDRPRLRGRIDFLNTIIKTVGTGKDAVDKPAVVIVAYISNIGSPTTVQGWQLSIQLEGQLKPITSGVEEIPDRLDIVSDAKGAPNLTLFGSDALYSKAVEVPIARGGAIRGILLFAFPGLTQQEISKIGTSYTLSFEDVVGNHYEALTRASTESRNPSGIHGFPGIKSKETSSQVP